MTRMTRPVGMAVGLNGAVAVAVGRNADAVAGDAVGSTGRLQGPKLQHGIMEVRGGNLPQGREAEKFLEPSVNPVFPNWKHI